MVVEERDIEYLKKLAGEAGYTLSDKDTDSFIRLFEMLIEKNRVMNLTAITEYRDVVEKHFADSLLIKSAITSLENEGVKIPDLAVGKLADMGTGAGFPGIPLKICNPEMSITLIDSLQKRIDYINEVVSELGLTNVETVHGRGEDVGRDKRYRETFDIVVSRAVASLPVLSEYCMPLVRKSGWFVAYKSGDIEEEVKEGAAAVKRFGGESAVVKKVTLPGTDIIRSFVFVKKTGNTPVKYPRKAGTPAKDPVLK